MLFGLRHVHGYTQFLAVLKHEFLDLRLVIQLHTIFGSAKAKFSFYAIHSLHSTLRNVNPV